MFSRQSSIASPLNFRKGAPFTHHSYFARSCLMWWEWSAWILRRKWALYSRMSRIIWPMVGTLKSKVNVRCASSWSFRLDFRDRFEAANDFEFQTQGKRRLMIKSMSMAISNERKPFLAWFNAIQVFQLCYRDVSSKNLLLLITAPNNTFFFGYFDNEGIFEAIVMLFQEIKEDKIREEEAKKAAQRRLRLTSHNPLTEQILTFVHIWFDLIADSISLRHDFEGWASVEAEVPYEKWILWGSTIFFFYFDGRESMLTLLLCLIWTEFSFVTGKGHQKEYLSIYMMAVILSRSSTLPHKLLWFSRFGFLLLCMFCRCLTLHNDTSDELKGKGNQWHKIRQGKESSRIYAWFFDGLSYSTGNSLMPKLFLIFPCFFSHCNIFFDEMTEFQFTSVWTSEYSS